MNKHFHRALSLFLAVALMLAMSAPVSAAQDGDILYITSVSDLIDLAKSCTLDTWSQGKTVKLTADLNLTGCGFSSIPTFGGVFDGDNHTISGLELTGSGSHIGLFRYIQKSGVVQNLTVRGVVVPGGTAESVGGIAGSNSGTISRSAFYGTVKGSANVGGIAGVNEEGGRISACSSNTAVTGERCTGGVAGRNLGTLLSCSSYGSINTSVTESSLSLDELNAGSVLDGLDGSSDRPGTAGTELSDQQDTGGIAGYSSGIIQSCINQGAVGYPHVGYNAGGIVGRQSGFLSGCSNTGHIQGRKDVGGIAGQNEPDVTISDDDTLSRIRSGLDRLSDLVDAALDHADVSADDISARLTAVGDQADSARDNARDLLDRTEDLLNENIDAVNDLSVTVTGALDRISPAMDDLSDAMDTLAELSDELGPVMDKLADASGAGSDMADELGSAVDDLKSAAGKTKTALGQIKSALDDLRQAVVSGDPAAVSQALANLSTGVRNLSTAMNEIAAAQQRLSDATGSGDLSEIAEANQALALATARFSAAVEQTGTALTVIQANASLEPGKLASALESLSAAMSSLSSAADDLQSALKQLGRAADSGEKLGGALQSAFHRLGSLSEDAEQAADLLSTAVDKIRDAVDYLRETGPITFTPVNDDYRAAGDRLFDSLSGISGAMGNLNEAVSGASDILSADLRAINRQFNTVMDLVLNALTDLRDGTNDKVSDRVQDVSEENVSAITLGRVDACLNAGVVEGDRNVGGILGAMAFDFDSDPEDDNTPGLSLGSSYETRALLLSCVNRGVVTGKKDCVGGVVGRMDLGFLSACQNYGDVESADGDYVGGIAGQASSTVQKSYAKCSLSGKRYVGGIAGYGETLRGCAAICHIDDGSECLGAVAGYADALDKVTDNYYIDTGLGGVDGISYAGHAQSAELDFLRGLDDVPAEFTAFRLILRADGRVVDTIPFTFGQRLSRLELPSPPEKEGYFGLWPTPKDDMPRSDVILDAEYAPWLTVVASRQADGARALALADGKFTSKAVLSVTDSTAAPPDSASSEAKVWDVTLTGTDLEDSAHVPLRLLCPGGGSVRVWTDDGWQDVPSHTNGSYMIVEMEGTSGTFCIEPSGSIPALALVLALAFLLAALLLLVCRRLKKRRAAVPLSSQKSDMDKGKKE